MLGAPMIQPMMYFQLNNIPMFRGATAITGETSANYNFFYLSTGNPVTYDQRTLIPIHYLDSPATTSATTYKTQQRQDHYLK